MRNGLAGVLLLSSLLRFNASIQDAYRHHFGK